MAQNKLSLGYSYAVFTRRLKGMALGRARFLGHVYHMQRVGKVEHAMECARRKWSHLLTASERVDVVLDNHGRYGHPRSPMGTGLL